ncbi:gas vesicle protein GvpA/GvpJ/GvpM family [Saccharopolyspora erythraea NRRL 2338]|uniref:Gas vesicle protein n=2 Tax=Saccharopolyspora erythraea TaxID=1836 RepID=A4F8C7_SACEN|nr:gas vesicle protein [Saccharopolyspora erythraea]EQD85334.1 gas vesicle protein [Saccharopolyspora erythraea D]PFG94097.1 gas vesicle protein GvpA/GvpJ/GvpM family [Saccharopolyspora erythraea NRRL 2338]QRK90889.1 gas vesicle protein [Saccharopolyspora erythraea]CAM00302.1 gas vesicle protein [Saccharopolyspora erythraea NRRL 2338]
MTGYDGEERRPAAAGEARAPAWYGQQQQRAAPPARQEGTNLADILERVLDKGIVIAGDIQVNLLDIELLTIKLRLVVASVERAREMGIDWWEHDPTLSSKQRNLVEENRRLQDQVRDLESQRDALRGEAETPELEDDFDDQTESASRSGQEPEPVDAEYEEDEERDRG